MDCGPGELITGRTWKQKNHNVTNLLKEYSSVKVDSWLQYPSDPGEAAKSSVKSG